jgi:hypothetical protein
MMMQTFSSSPLIPGIPADLETYVGRFYSNEVLARRAILAPWPWSTHWRSAWDDRHLWERYPEKQSERDERAEYERLIALHNGSQTDYYLRKFADVEDPFFVSEGTLGTLRSPYPQMSDREYWLFVNVWGSEESARRVLESPICLYPGRKKVSAIAYLNEERIRGGVQKLMDQWFQRPDPLSVIWDDTMQRLTGTYS